MTIAFSISNDIIVPSVEGETYRGGGGDDMYILSNATNSGDPIVIVDTEGINTIQLIDGLSIESSMIMQDAVQLTLSNNAVVQILGASTFTYDVGGNAILGDTGTEIGYNSFATQVLGGTVPTEPGDFSTGGPVVIDENTLGDENIVSADIGSLDAAETLDASGGNFVFTDDATVSNHVEISNFASGDVIEISNAVAGDYTFEHDGTDMNIIYNNDGVVNHISLLGVVSPEDLLYTEALFEAAIGFDAVTYA